MQSMIPENFIHMQKKKSLIKLKQKREYQIERHADGYSKSDWLVKEAHVKKNTV